MLKDVEQHTLEVNTESENEDNNSGSSAKGPSGLLERSNGAGTRGELGKIAAALATLSSQTFEFREDGALFLKWYFGRTRADVGYSIFSDWIAETRHYDGDAVDASKEWDAARVPDGTLLATTEPSLAKLLLFIRQRARGKARRITWTDTADDGVAPIGNSQFNVQALLDELGIAVYRNDFSGKRHIEGFEDFDELTDDALNALWLKAEALGLRTKTDYFSSVVRELARRNARNPVRDYFRSVIWDEKPRLDTWLHDYAGAENNELNREFGKLWMIAAVRRVRKPGTKFDQILVLEGEQGAGKSSLARILANAVGPGLFEDGLQLGAETRQVIEATRSKLIVEISELRGNNRDVEAVKAMLSRIEDSARLAYGRETSHVPRQFVMIGTTNSSEYLVDPTGNRRFWPVKVGRVDLKGLAEDAPQLWAEAALREAEDVSLELPRKFWDAAQSEQSERVMGDPVYDVLSAKLGDDGGEINMNALFTMIGLDETKTDRRTRAMQTAIGRAMSQIPGWQRVRLRDGGQRVYVYKKPAHPDRPEREFAWYVGPGGEVRTDPLSLGSAPERVVPLTPSNRRNREPAVPTVPTPVPTERE